MIVRQRLLRISALSCGTLLACAGPSWAADPIVNPFAAGGQKPAIVNPPPSNQPIQNPFAPQGIAATPANSAPTAGNAGPGVASITKTAAGVSLRFENAEIYEVVQAVLGDVLNLDYSIDPSLQGRITLRSTTAVSQADIYNVLEGALSLSNIAIVRDGQIYRVMRDANAVRDSLGLATAGPHGLQMQIIPVKYVQASQLVNTLRNFVGPQSAMTNDPTNHYLIVADRGANLAKITEMVKTLDVDYLKQVKIKLVPLSQGEATEVAKEMEILFKTSGLLNWSGTDANKVHFVPVVRSNSVLIAAANESVLDAAEKWLRTLDAPTGNALSESVHVYPLANNNATHVANILRQIFGQQAVAGNQSSASTTTGASSSGGQQQAATGLSGGGAATTAPSRTIVKGSVPGGGGSVLAGHGLSGAVTVIADEGTNTLVIRAGGHDYQQIRKVIERIDTMPRQVLVQVMVAEISLNDSLQYGVEWYLRSRLSTDGKSWLAKASLDSGLTAPSGNTISGAVGAAASGLNYAVLNGAGDVIGLLNLLGQTTDVNVLSSPHVLATDGKLAKIEVGSDEPVVTATVSTPTTVTGGLSTSNSVQYRPTGILLEVKPSINDSGMVSLNISQEVSGRGAKNVVVGGSEYPSFSKRKVTTDVTLAEGTTLIIGGLIQDRGNNGTLGVPILKDLPLLGGLFGTTSKGREKTELMITVTPYVVKNKADGDRVTADFRKGLGELKSLLERRGEGSAGQSGE